MTKLLAQTPAIQIAMNKNKLAIVDPRLRLRTEFHFDRFIVCLLKSENAKFTIFPTSSFCGGYTQHCKDKLNASRKLQAFSYTNLPKKFLYSNALMAKTCAQTLSFKSMTAKK